MLNIQLISPDRGHLALLHAKNLVAGGLADRVEIQGVVAPCARMDEASQGFQAALDPPARAGIWGQVVSGGAVRLGDVLNA